VIREKSWTTFTFSAIYRIYTVIHEIRTAAGREKDLLLVLAGVIYTDSVDRTPEPALCPRIPWTERQNSRNVHKYAQIHAKIQIDAPLGEGTSFHRFPVSFARVVLSCCGTSIVSLHVFVYIACRFRRCTPSRECEQVPRILARISINCVYERMVRC
jgi:hypothetical protein